MKEFIKKNWRLCYGLYTFIYLPWFFILEKVITPDTPGVHILNTSIDEAIPFCEYFIVPYVLWFAYILVACVYMIMKGTDTEFRRFALSLILGMSISLLICMIYPSGLTLRPTELRDNIFAKMVAGIYASDTPTNVFPSIHVYNSLACHIAFAKCKDMKNHKVWKMLSLILCILICLSTVFLKQHSILDVIGGFILMGILYILLYVVDYSHIFKKRKEVELSHE